MSEGDEKDRLGDTLARKKRGDEERFFAEQDRLRGGPAPELCSPDYRATIGSNPTFDRAGHEHFATAFYAGIPDATHDVQLVIATPESVVVRFVIRGTHTGEFLGVAPTGVRVAVSFVAIVRIADGRLIEEWGGLDQPSLFR